MVKTCNNIPKSFKCVSQKQVGHTSMPQIIVYAIFNMKGTSNIPMQHFNFNTLLCGIVYTELLALLVDWSMAPLVLVVTK